MSMRLILKLYTHIHIQVNCGCVCLYGIGTRTEIVTEQSWRCGFVTSVLTTDLLTSKRKFGGGKLRKKERNRNRNERTSARKQASKLECEWQRREWRMRNNKRVDTVQLSDNAYKSDSKSSPIHKCRSFFSRSLLATWPCPIRFDPIRY